MAIYVGVLAWPRVCPWSHEKRTLMTNGNKSAMMFSFRQTLYIALSLQCICICALYRALSIALTERGMHALSEPYKSTYLLIRLKAR